MVSLILFILAIFFLTMCVLMTINPDKFCDLIPPRVKKPRKIRAKSESKISREAARKAVRKIYCKHEWEQIGKRYEVDKETGVLMKILINRCVKCGKMETN